MNKPAGTQMHCFAIDLVNDPELITQYENYHKKEMIWPEIVEGIKAVGIIEMNIFRAGNRLMMIIEISTGINLANAFKQMESLPRQKEWAKLMKQFQVRIPAATPGEHWSLMKQVFDLNG